MCVNASINTLGAITGTDCGQTVEHLERPLRQICEEVESVARAMGIADLNLAGSVDAVVARYAGQHGLRSSMLQDLEAGRELERAAIADALVELGSRLGVRMPTLELVAALLGTLDKTRREQGGVAK